MNILESQLGKQLHSQSVIDAYLHFDSLSQHSYEYSCTLCGYHPKILIMDLNKKVAFNCNVSNLELPEKYQMDDADLVDCDEFWGKVELSMILRGFSNCTVPKFKVNSNLLFWSPFIGRHTRKGPLLLNTEHRKVSRSTGELESDCREISEERLLELLHNYTYKEVNEIAQSISTPPRGSKLDVIMQIKQAISKDDEKFKKASNKILSDAPICQTPLYVRHPYMSDAPICQTPLFVTWPYLSDAPICQTPLFVKHPYLSDALNVRRSYLSDAPICQMPLFARCPNTYIYVYIK